MFNKSGFYFILLLIISVIAFWESYFSIFFNDIDSYPHLSEVDNYVHFHAATMLLWIGMLISQAFLIRFNKKSAHRFIGKFSYVLVPFIIVSLILLAHSQLTIHDFGLTYGRLYILFLQLSLLAIFIISYGLAITHRHTPARHARYMICTALTMIDPAVARFPIDTPSLPFSYQVVTFGITDIILIILIILERKKTTGREVFPVMLGVFLFFQIINLTSTRSQIWDGFALWFAKLPLT